MVEIFMQGKSFVAMIDATTPEEKEIVTKLKDLSRQTDMEKERQTGNYGFEKVKEATPFDNCEQMSLFSEEKSEEPKKQPEKKKIVWKLNKI